jgi:hypothetical protein
LTKVVKVGTTPKLLLPHNPHRRAWSVDFPSTAVFPSNTGVVFVSKGAPPTTTLGDPTNGDILIGGASVGEFEQYPNDPSVYKGEIWAAASIDNQTILVNEITKLVEEILVEEKR